MIIDLFQKAEVTTVSTNLLSLRILFTALLHSHLIAHTDLKPTHLGHFILNY